MTKHEKLHGYTPICGPFFIQIASELKMLEDAEALFDRRGTKHQRKHKVDANGVESVMLWREVKGMCFDKNKHKKGDV